MLGWYEWVKESTYTMSSGMNGSKKAHTMLGWYEWVKESTYTMSSGMNGSKKAHILCQVV